MEGGERKEAAAALPSDYVSLAQLQERWRKKQEEAKLEEEEKRERDALALKQKQEREERERDARAQSGRVRDQNRNQSGGGFVRGMAVIQEKGKGKEIVCGGPGDGGENNNNIGKKGGRVGKNKRNFKGAAASREREKDGAEAEVLSGEGGSVVELKGCGSVVEVLPRNGEIDHVNRSDLRGGFKRNGRGKGSLRVNELRQSEEEGGDKKCSESGKGGEIGGDGGSERGVDRVRGSEEEGERRRGSERGRDRGKGGEVGSERGVDRRRRSEEEGERRGGNERGRGGRRKNGGDPERRINMLKEYRSVISDDGEVKLKMENKADQDEISEVRSGIASLRVGDVNETRGQDNRAKEGGSEGKGSNMDKVAVEIEKKQDHRVLARKGENRGSWKGYRAIGFRGHDNKAKDDGVEGEGSTDEIVAVEIEKKVDQKVLSRKGENRGHGRQGNGIQGQEIRIKEDGVEGGCSNGEEVALEIEKKVDHKALPRKGENRSYGRVYREIGIWGGENKAKEDVVEGGGSNSEALAVEIEKEVDHKVLPIKGENRNSWSAYPANGNRSRDFGRGRSHMRPDIHDDFRRKPRESSMVWVKKEDRLNA